MYPPGRIILVVRNHPSRDMLDIDYLTAHKPMYPPGRIILVVRNHPSREK